jgi:hypothetical protein
LPARGWLVIWLPPRNVAIGAQPAGGAIRSV